ncbi:MAG: hypothetical protein AAF183_17845 [Pseudomonadota bacterium]
MSRGEVIQKGLPLATAVTLALAIIGALWSAAQQSATIDENTRRIAKLERSVEPLGARLAQIDTKLDFIIERINRMENADD